MEAYVVETPIGVFVIDDKLNVLDKVFFAKAPHLAAAELKQIQEGNITTGIIEALRNTGKSATLVFENELFAKAVEQANLQAVTKKEFCSRCFPDQVGI